VEAEFQGCYVSILLLNQKDQRLRYGSSGSLPAGYTAALDGVAVGPAEGSCGTAVYRNEAVIAADIATDPLRVQYRDAAVRHGIRASWSTPIRASDRRVLGTFAILSSEPGQPSARHLRVIEQMTHLASVAIARSRMETALAESEERFRSLADAIPEVIWITALSRERVLYTSPSFERIWGRSVQALYENPRLWTEVHSPGRP
jgi:GAF domain-containing protein